MGTETADMNETRFSSYAAHDHDPNALTYADLHSMYLLCIWQAWYKARAHNPSHKQQGTCAQAFEILRGPAERSRIRRQQLKAQEDMSLGNFYRSVHHIRSNKEQKREKYRAWC